MAVAYQNKLPFVAYKRANSKKIRALFQEDDSLHQTNSFSENGFVFAPFDSQKPAVFIAADSISEAEVSVLLEVDKKADTIFAEETETALQHVDFVKNTKEFIHTEKVAKIVIARTKDIQKTDFSALESFKKLVGKYVNATCYILYHPKIGLWMGATPETLLEIEKNRFSTMSLAGTQKYQGSENVAWGEKEIEEQQLVTDYVVSNLEKVSQTLEKSDTYTVKAGALLHLRTDISGTLKDGLGIESLVSVLHPTPAVCGFPSDLAKEYILANEAFDRTFYTGFLGEINTSGTTSLYVNLRCLQYVNNKITLYVGGGITSKSDPELEWQETVAKCKTMESIL